MYKLLKDDLKKELDAGHDGSSTKSAEIIVRLMALLCLAQHRSWDSCGRSAIYLVDFSLMLCDDGVDLDEREVLQLMALTVNRVIDANRSMDWTKRPAFKALIYPILESVPAMVR